jgi:hypothetical protein
MQYLEDSLWVPLKILDPTRIEYTVRGVTEIEYSNLLDFVGNAALFKSPFSNFYGTLSVVKLQCAIPPATLQRLVGIIESSPVHCNSIHALLLPENSTFKDPEAICDLSRLLHRLPFLEEFSFASNLKSSPVGLKTLCEAIAENKTITRLNVMGLKLEADWIVNMMRKNKTVTALNILGNRLMSEGANKIAHCFSENSIQMPLEELEIGENAIGPEASTNLLQALNARRGYTNIAMTWNQMTDDCIPELKKLIQQNELRELVLNMNKFSVDGLKEIFQTVAEHAPKMEFLDLSCSLHMEILTPKPVNGIVLMTAPDMENTPFADDDFGLSNLILHHEHLAILGFIELFADKTTLRILRSLEFNSSLLTLIMRMKRGADYSELMQCLKSSSIEKILGDNYMDRNTEVRAILQENKRRRCSNGRIIFLHYIHGLMSRIQGDWRSIAKMVFENAGIAKEQSK